MSPISGRLLDNYGAQKPIMTGAVFEIIGGLLYCIFASSLTSGKIILFYAITMLGIGLVMGDTMTASIGQLAESENTDGNGLFNMAQQFAGAVGTAIISAIMQFVEQTSSQTSVTGKYIAAAQVGLIFILMIVLIGVYLLYAATKPVKQRNKIMNRLGLALQRVQNTFNRNADYYARKIGLTGTQMLIIEYLASFAQNKSIYQKILSMNLTSGNRLLLMFYV